VSIWLLGKYAIMTPNKLRHMVANVTPVSDSIMNALSASDVSTMLYALGIKMTRETTMRYLNPIRDMPEHEGWIKSQISDGRKVVLVGKDVIELRDRIMNPVKFWSENVCRREIHVWIAVPDFETFLIPSTELLMNRMTEWGTFWAESMEPNQSGIKVFFFVAGLSSHPPPALIISGVVPRLQTRHERLLDPDLIWGGPHTDNEALNVTAIMSLHTSQPMLGIMGRNGSKRPLSYSCGSTYPNTGESLFDFVAEVSLTRTKLVRILLEVMNPVSV